MYTQELKSILLLIVILNKHAATFSGHFLYNNIESFMMSV